MRSYFKTELWNQICKKYTSTTYVRRVINVHIIYFTILCLQKSLLIFYIATHSLVALLCFRIIGFFTPKKSNSQCQQEKSQKEMVKQTSHWFSDHKITSPSLSPPSTPPTPALLFSLMLMKPSFGLENKCTLSWSETEKVETERLKKVQIKTTFSQTKAFKRVQPRLGMRRMLYFLVPSDSLLR